MPGEFMAALTETAGVGAISTAQSNLEPFIQGPDTALWVGFVAFVVIFIGTMIAIIRSRVIQPAEAKSRENNFFEPAGENAEITFDDPDNPAERPLSPAEQRKAEKEAKKARRQQEKEEKRRQKQEAKNAAAAEGDLIADEGPAEEANQPTGEEVEPIILQQEEVRENKPSPFASIFSRRDKANGDASTHEDLPQDANDDDEKHAHMFQSSSREDDPFSAHAVFDEDGSLDQQREEIEALEKEREAAFQAAEQARAEADAQRRAREEQDAQREAEFERRKAEAALEQRLQSLSKTQRSIDERTKSLSVDTSSLRTQIADLLDERLATMNTDISRRFATITQALETALAQQTDHAGAAFVGEQIRSALRENSVDQEATLKSITERVEKLAATAPPPDSTIARLTSLLAEKSVPAAAAPLQLQNIVRAALPADQYRINAKLTSGAVASALITLPGSDDGFVVDSGYPIEAFNEYVRSSDGSDDEEVQYQRAVLRHLIFVSDKLIAKGETADFAIVLTPTDIIFNDLHAKFPEIIQDGYRARVWFSSPTTLGAMLHLLGAANQYTPQRQDDDDKANALEARLATLEARIEDLQATMAAPTADAEQRLTELPDAADSENEDKDVSFHQSVKAAATSTPVTPAPTANLHDIFGVPVKPATEPTKTADENSSSQEPSKDTDKTD